MNCIQVPTMVLAFIALTVPLEASAEACPTSAPVRQI